MSHKNTIYKKTICKHIFENGDILILEESSGVYYEYGALKYLVLMYGEYYKDEGGYYATHSEYFHLSDRELAIKAFEKRLASPQPSLASNMGVTLAEIKDRP